MSERNGGTLDLSIVIPLHNEADNVDPLIAELYSTLENLGLSFELILVDDGSTDETFVRMRAQADQRRSEERRVGQECRSRGSPYH